MRPLATPILIVLCLAVSSMLSDRGAQTSVQEYLESTNRISKTAAAFGTKDARPTGLRLVLIGDSITRHQYLSLAYFLRHGKWFKPKKKPHLVNQNHFTRTAPTKAEGWATFFRETNKLLSPLERCDCVRKRWGDVTLVDNHVIENRYFYDPERNNTLTYLLGFGNTISGLHGRISPEDAFRDIPAEYQYVNSTWKWRYMDWGEALEKYVARLAATHVLMNAGYWPHDFDTNKEARDNIVKACQKTGLVGIWRTNSYLYNQEIRPLAVNADEAMKGLFGDNVLDVNWTYGLKSKYYWDDKHFNEPVYRVMNEELLEMVGHRFPSNYEKQSLEPLLRDVTENKKNTEKKKK